MLAKTAFQYSKTLRATATATVPFHHWMWPLMPSEHCSGFWLKVVWCVWSFWLMWLLALRVLSCPFPRYLTLYHLGRREGGHPWEPWTYWKYMCGSSWECGLSANQAFHTPADIGTFSFSSYRSRSSVSYDSSVPRCQSQSMWCEKGGKYTLKRLAKGWWWWW